MLKRIFSFKYRWIILILYFILLVISIVFKFFSLKHLDIEVNNEYNNYKLFYFPYYNKEFVIQCILNVLSFIPFGFLLVIVINKYEIVLSLLFIILSSLCFEIIQLEFKIGIFDINDLFFNVFGGLFGATCCITIKRRIS